MYHARHSAQEIALVATEWKKKSGWLGKKKRIGGLRVVMSCARPETQLVQCRATLQTSPQLDRHVFAGKKAIWEVSELLPRRSIRKKGRSIGSEDAIWTRSRLVKLLSAEMGRLDRLATPNRPGNSQLGVVVESQASHRVF